MGARYPVISDCRAVTSSPSGGERVKYLNIVILLTKSALVTLVILQICVSSWLHDSTVFIVSVCNCPEGRGEMSSKDILWGVSEGKQAFCGSSAKVAEARQALKLRSLSGRADCLSLSSSRRHLVFEAVA